MNNKKRNHIKRISAVCAALALAAGLCTTAYAADFCGIQRSIQLWTKGDQTNAVLEIQQGQNTSYDLTFEDKNGEKHEVHGGGVAFDAFGNETPLTEEDIIEHINDTPEVIFDENGTVTVYYKEQTLDITDSFTDGVSYVQLKDGDKTIYLTVKEDGSYGTSNSCYCSPEEWE